MKARRQLSSAALNQLYSGADNANAAQSSLSSISAPSTITAQTNGAEIQQQLYAIADQLEGSVSTQSSEGAGSTTKQAVDGLVENAKDLSAGAAGVKKEARCCKCRSKGSKR